MALAGTLEIQLLADVARLKKDMAEMNRTVNGAMGSVERSVASAKAALGALGVGLSVGALVAFAKHTLDATAALDDFAEMTGASVESLSALRQVARVSGQDFGNVVTAMGKLAKGLSGVDDESKGVGNALAAVGLDLKTIQGMKADEQMQAIAKALSGYDDSASKAAVAQALFGKAGAQLLPYLKDLAEWGQLNASVTTKQSAEAEKAQKQWNRLKSDFEDTSAVIMSKLIPALSNIVDGFKKAQTQGDNFFVAFWRGLTNTSQLDELVAKRDRLLKDNANPITGWMGKDTRMQRIGEINEQILRLQESMETVAPATEKATKGVINFSSATDKDAAAVKKAAEEYQKLIFGIKEKTLLSQMERDATEKLTEGEKALAKMHAGLVAEYNKLSPAQKKTVDGLLAQQIAAEQAAQGWDEYTAKVKQAYDDEIAWIESGKEVDKMLYEQGKLLSDLIDPLEERAKSAEREIELYGKTAAQIEALQLARLKEARAIASANGALPEHIAFYDRLIEQQGRLTTAADTKEGLDKQVELWKSIESTAHDTFISIFDSGKSAFDRLRDTLKNGLYELLWQMTAKKWFFDVSVTGSGQGAAGAVSNAVSGGGGFNPLGFLSSGPSFTNAVGNLGFAFSDFTSLIDTGLGVFDAAGIAFQGMASSFATVLGPLGIAVGLASMLLKPGGGPKTEGDYFGVLGAGGLLTQQATETGGNGIWYTGNSGDATAAQIALPIGDAIFQAVRALGGNATGLGINLGYNTDPQGDAPDNVSAGVTDAFGNYVYRQTYDVGRGEAGEALQVEVQRMILAALQATDLADVVDAYLDTVDIKGLTGEQAAAALKYVKALNDTGKAMERLGFGADSLTPTLINAAGGLESLQASLSSFYDLYYTETEKQAMAQADLLAQFEALNLALPESKGAFRDLVEGIDRSTTAGEEMFAALLRLAPAFAQVADAAEAAAQQATAAARQSADAQAEMWRGWRESQDAAERAEAEARLRALEEQRRAAEEAQRIADQQAAAFATWTSGLREWLDALNQNDQLSPLTAQQKLLEAQNVYVEGLMLAQAGDAAARGNITRYAEEYLAAQKAVSGFGGAYSSVFSSVRDQIDQLAGGGSSQDAPPTSGDIGSLKQELTDVKVVLARLMERGNADAQAIGAAIVAAITDSGTTISTATTTAAVLTKKA